MTHDVSLCIFAKSRKRSQQLKQHKKGINEYENKIIRFYYYQAYFSVLFNTSYYIIIITPLHSVPTFWMYKLCFFVSASFSLQKTTTKNVSLYHHQLYLFAVFILLLYFFIYFFTIYSILPHTWETHKTISSIQLKTYFRNNIIWIWFFFVILY